MSRTSRLLNAVPSLVLRSPAHRLMSSRYALLEFTGRRSGRTHRTPGAYLRQGSHVLLSTDSPWWHNLTDEPAVRLRLRGHELTGVARVIAEDSEAATVLGQLVQGVPGYARPAGLHRTNGQASEAELLRAVTSGRRRRSIDVALDTPR